MACTQVMLDIKQCSLCNEQLSLEESLCIKGQCKICLCKKVQLVQVFGKWPVPAFVKFTGLQQVNFWKEARTCTKKFDLEALLVKQISSVRVDLFDTSGGAFKPLSIYAREGYSNEALVNIEKNSCSRWDEELEMYTYKLVVVEERKAAIYRGVEQELIEWKHSSALRQKMLPYGSPAGKAGKKKRKRTKSSTSSSSSKDSNDSKDIASGQYKSKGSAGSVCELSEESDSESPRSKAKRAKAEAETTLRAEKLAAEVQRNNDKQARVAATEAKKAGAAEAKKQAALVKEQKASQTAAGKELAKAAKKKDSVEAQAAKKKASEDIPCNV